MIEEWLAQFDVKSKEDLIGAKREIMQTIVLAGLSRGGFFKNATFYGGTALKFFHGLDRFSEDLDFSLNYNDIDFSLEKYFDSIIDEFSILGLDVSISLKQKKSLSPVESAFLKEDTIWGLITLDEKSRNATNFPVSKIKIEIDRTPPLLFKKEELYLKRPYTFYVACMTKESLFAGKMHAVLFREWKNRIKGRDWYDLEWFIKNNVSLPLIELNDRGSNSGHIPIDLNEATFRALLCEKIEGLNVDLARRDVEDFIFDSKSLQSWSTRYFLDLAEKITIS